MPLAIPATAAFTFFRNRIDSLTGDIAERIDFDYDRCVRPVARLVEFPSVERAEAFYRSPEYTEAIAARKGAAVGQFVVVEGV